MTTLLASASLPIGQFIEVRVGGFTFNADTVWGSALAAVIVIAMGLAVAKSASKEVPGKLQLLWEMIYEAVKKQTEGSLGGSATPVIPLVVTLFMFILVANLLEILPTGARAVALPAPTADVNLTYAMAAVVFVVYTSAALRHRGVGGYFRGFLQPHWALTPINVIEEVVKPFTLALRLFGNMFSGGLMIMLLSLLPAYIAWLPTSVWKLFDMFIALIQAFIFALLTLLYYQAAVSDTGH